MSEQFNDKVYTELLKCYQSLNDTRQAFEELHGYISNATLKDHAVARIKEDPKAVKNIMIAMPVRTRHFEKLSLCDWRKLHVPKMFRYVGVATEYGKPHAIARNTIIEEVLTAKIPTNGPESSDVVDYLLWIDDDVILPRDAIQKFVESKEPVICGVYHYKKSDSHPMNRYWADKDAQKVEYIDRYDKVGIQDCDFLAPTGCLWVDLKAIRGITRPFFESSFIEEGLPHGYQFGEDRYFTEKCVQAGIVPKVHKGVQCVHVDVNTNKAYGHSDLVHPEKNFIYPEVLDQLAIRRFREMT